MSEPSPSQHGGTCAGPLDWPPEAPDAASAATRLDVPASNWVLDLHGSIQDPDLVLFMAGNQFRALPDLLSAFRASVPAREAGLTHFFYATTPPGRLIDCMQSGWLATGNFQIEIRPGRLWPDAFMAGPREHARLAVAGYAGDAAQRYARNRGMTLLVRTGNPLGVQGVRDLLRGDATVIMPSRERESAAFDSYSRTIDAQGGAGLTQAVLGKPSTLHPKFVHHREVPQAIADGLGDVGPVYRHLGDYLVTQFPGTFARVELPDTGNHADELSVAILRDAPRPVAARLWRDFLLSPGAAAILQRHGFDDGASAGR